MSLSTRVRGDIPTLGMEAELMINAKHTQLGGDTGLLGPALSPSASCPDHIGLFRKYTNGVIYHTPTTGTHEVHGAILAKWSSLGFERSFLGYPLTDET